MNKIETQAKGFASGGARPAVIGALCIAAALLAGCAAGPNAHPRDPLEPWNRGVYEFNDTLDTAVLKPVATAYKAVTPQPVRTGVDNFFGNLRDVWSVVNSALQLKPLQATEGFFRVAVNTVFGFGGVVDIASDLGLEARREDFGQTLGRWGVPTGPYLVLPLLGPSTLRDTAALPADRWGNLEYRVDHIPTRNSLIALDVVDTRASLLRAGQVLEEAALDKYSFVRDAYLQKRRNDVFDGNPPDDEEPAADPSATPDSESK